MSKKITTTLFFNLILMLSFNVMAAENITKTVKKIWQQLDQTKNQCPDVFDYFPEGGLRIFYCHMKTFLDYEQLQQLSPVTIFTQGPHDKTQLNLYAQNEFGYYNPAFVKWLTQNFLPASQNARFKKQTQPLYLQYVKPLARTYYMVHERLMADPDYLQKEKANYLRLIKMQNLPDYYADKFFEFADLYEQGFNGNIVKTGVLFWIRRLIDGTEPAFFSGLQKLLNTYDSQFINDIKCQLTEVVAEQIDCAKLDYKAIETELKQNYQQLHDKLDQEGRIKLKHSQSAWYQFIDLNAIFWANPYRKDLDEEQLTQIKIKIELVKARIKELESFKMEMIE